MKNFHSLCFFVPGKGLSYDPRQIHGIHIVVIVLDQADEIQDIFGDVVIVIIGKVQIMMDGTVPVQQRKDVHVFGQLFPFVDERHGRTEGGCQGFCGKLGAQAHQC